MAPGDEGAWPTHDARPTLSRAEVRQIYDQFAATDRNAGQDTESGYGGPAIQALLGFARLEGPQRVYEYGCGKGKLAKLLLERYPGVTYVGVDASPNMVEQCRRAVMAFGTERATVAWAEVRSGGQYCAGLCFVQSTIVSCVC